MTTVRQYVAALRPVARNVARTMGEDVGLEDRTQRIVLNMIMGMVCVLIKLLVDKGLITDADVTVAFTTFNNTPADYPDVPAAPPLSPPETAAGQSTGAQGQGTAYDAGASS